MRNRQPSPQQAAAVSRRLAALSAELAVVRNEAPSGPADWQPPSSHTRVRTGDRPDTADVPTGPDATAAPPPASISAPGRHAARRPRPGVGLPGGLRLGAAHLAVVLAVVAVAVGIAAWLAVRHQGEPAAQPEVTPVGQPLLDLPEAEGSPGAGGEQAGAPGEDPDAQAGEVVVDVAGKVRRPGIAVLPSGSRVVDALDAAGGARRGADLTGLNLARLLVDGEQVLVGVAGPQGVAGSVGAAPEPGVRLVSLNTADQATLETLPGVGPVTATAILDWRTTNGAFTSVDELLEVDGIGEATLADLAPLVTL